MPWELPKYLEYKERHAHPPQSTPPATTHTYTNPRQSTIQITPLPQKIRSNKLEVDTLVTPPLVPEAPYLYHFRVRWFENGKWVTQMHAVWLKAGDVHCLDIVPQDAP